MKVNSLGMPALDELENPCHWFGLGTECKAGVLYDMQTQQPVLLEGQAIKCHACEGRGMVLTSYGKAVMEMIWRHMEPKVIELMQQLKERQDE